MSWLVSLAQDLRHGLRTLLANRGFAAIAIGSLALGIGANTAIFSVFDGLFLGSLPYASPERLVFVDQTDVARGLTGQHVAAIDADLWREHSTTFDNLAAFLEGGWSLSGFGDSVRIQAAWTQCQLGPTLGVMPVLGRYFTDAECRSGAHVALLSHRMWQRLFSGSPAVLGQVVKLDKEPYEVIGILPQSAVYPADADAWFPLDNRMPPGAYALAVAGRLKAGVSVAQAQAELVQIHKSAAPIRPANRFTEPRVSPLRERYVGAYRLITGTLMVAVGVVLLIACVNVAGLTLARSSVRSREAAVRAALGASRARLIQQILSETLILTILGGAAGVALGWVALNRLLPLLPPEVIPSWVAFHLNARFVAFAVACTAATAVLTGIRPALEFSRADVRAAMIEAAPRTSLSRARRRTLDLLVAGEVTLAVVLLSGGGLLLKAFYKVLATDPGFRAPQTLTFAVNPPYEDQAMRQGYYRRILDSLRLTPGVDAVAQSNLPPYGKAGVERSRYNLRAPGMPPRPVEQAPQGQLRVVMPGYFRALGIRLKAGREFDERDLQHSGPAPVIVSETLARQLWPDSADPLGRAMETVSGKPLRMQVVGIAIDIPYEGLELPPQPWFYSCETYPGTAFTGFHMYFSVRGRRDSGTLANVVRQTVLRADPALAIYEVETIDELVDRSLGLRRVYSWLFTGFAAIALALAVAGIYGVVSYVAAQRTREIGIRLALGASPLRVGREVLRSTMALAAAGCALGLCASWFLTRALTGLLAGISPHDPWAYGAVLALVSLAVFAGAFGPARRAASMDPATALRHE